MSTPDISRETSREQDAVRILLIISAAATPIPGDGAGGSDWVAVLESQVRLQKLDFWVRNPDYFSIALMQEYQETSDQRLFDLAQSILDSEEPEVRRYPMLRYLFGAWERLDDALAVLRSAGLVVRRRRGAVGTRAQSFYYLTRRGREVAERIVREHPVFRYFVDRTRLVADFTDGRLGTHLKELQYRQEEYRDTELRQRIRPVTPRARALLEELGRADDGGRRSA
ncbi:hypothetical protein [Virgisporangium aliadipatigenens]|uniref:hypothetical protein n=1 Tax=Virgisporangium aliadipatigenens TaxID=741659 RepID=UPI001EF2DF8B|nr:hypothetical protein [Virgisporangium aliadipatigenens]